MPEKDAESFVSYRVPGKPHDALALVLEERRLRNLSWLRNCAQAGVGVAQLSEETIRDDEI